MTGKEAPTAQGSVPENAGASFVETGGKPDPRGVNASERLSLVG